MNNVILMFKISTVGIAVLIVILVALTVLWIRVELRAKRAEASLEVYRGRVGKIISEEDISDEKDDGGKVMKNYYFTYGTSPQYPFRGGWTVVVAEDKLKAVAAFRAYHEDAEVGLMNCAFVYDQEEMEKSGMLASGNEGEFCRERIVLMNDRGKLG